MAVVYGQPGVLNYAWVFLKHRVRNGRLSGGRRSGISRAAKNHPTAPPRCCRRRTAMTQLCHPFQSHDSLSRDHMLHVADSGGSDLVSRIVLGVFIGVLLAIATLLSEAPPQTVERLTLPTDR